VEGSSEEGGCSNDFIRVKKEEEEGSAALPCPWEKVRRKAGLTTLRQGGWWTTRTGASGMRAGAVAWGNGPVGRGVGRVGCVGGWPLGRWFWAGPKNSIFFDLYKQILNCLEFESIKWRSSQTLFLKINYGFELFGIRNSFTYRNFSQFKNYFELKFKKASMVWKSMKFDWIWLGLPRIDEIWTGISWLHLDGNQFIKGSLEFKSGDFFTFAWRFK
jgi:hypothetical protein